MMEGQGKMQSNASEHSCPQKVTHLGLGFDPEPCGII